MACGKEDFRVDMDEVRKIALDTRPAVICAGWSAYPVPGFRRVP